MKKVICFIIAVLLALGTAACSPDANNHTEKPNKDETEKSTYPGASNSNTTEIPDKPEENVLQVPSKEIYFSLPDGWSYSTETYSTVLMETDECLIAVCYNWAIPYEGNLEGLVDFFSSGVLRDVAPYSKGYLGAAQITTTSTEELKIGGKDSVKFTGTVNNTDWDCHIYGYAMIVNNVPMMVIGLVSTQAQDAQMIEDIDALTDQIAASVRTEK